MRSFKVCMIGDFAVGKTSLVRRFVHGIYDARYLTTVGVKIDTRELELDGVEVKLVLWDIAGNNALSTIERRYLAGSAGYLLVADGTRNETLRTALKLDDEVQAQLGPVPRALLVNKLDLEATWEVDRNALARLQSESRPLFATSALSGSSVATAFETLGRRLLEA